MAESMLMTGIESMCSVTIFGFSQFPALDICNIIIRMSQVVINRALVSRPIYDKILGRMTKIRQCIETAANYYKNVQQLLKNYYKDVRAIFQELQDKSRTSNFYSNERCIHLMEILSRIKDIRSGLERSTILNVERLDKFNQQVAVKSHNKLHKQIDKFCNSMAQYAQKSLKIEKKINSYKEDVNFLKQSINKYQNIQDPIHFYNPAEFQKSLTKLDQRYKSLQEKESMLFADVHIMQIQKKYLQGAMKDLRDVTFEVLYAQSECLNGMVTILVQGCQERLDLEPKICRNSSNTEQLYISELSNMKKIYEKFSIPKDNESYHNPFPKQILLSQVDPNLKLYEERCSNLISLKKVYLYSSEEFIYKVKEYFKKMLLSMEETKKSFIGTTDKIIGSSNKMEKFQKDIWKYLGERQIQIFNLSKIILSSQNRAFNQIIKRMNPIFKQFESKIQQRSSLLPSFQEGAIKALEQHKLIKKKINQQTVISEQDFQLFEESVKKSFTQLVDHFQKMNQKQQDFFSYVQIKIRDMVSAYCNFMQTTTYDFLAKENPKQVQAFKKRNQQKQILDIMTKDQRYEVLFNDFFYQSSSKNRTSFIKEDYDKIRNILQKKNYIVTMGNKYQNKNYSVLCCVSKAQSDKLHPKIQTKCQLQDKKQLIQGTLKVYPECISFHTTKSFLKDEKILIIVPKKEILSIQKKDITHSSQKALQLTTQMGEIVFHNVQKNTQVFQFLNKQMVFSRRESNESLNDQRSRSFSQHHSMVSKMVTVTDKHTPNTSRDIQFKRGGINHEGLDDIGKKEELLSMEKLMQINQGIQKFEIIKEELNQPFIRRKYKHTVLKLDYIIKQVRQIKLQEKQFVVKMRWRGECNNDSDAFQLAQRMTGEVFDDRIVLYAQFKSIQYFQRYIDNYFKQFIKDMSRMIMKKIGNIFNKSCTLNFYEEIQTYEHIETNPKFADNIQNTSEQLLKTICPIIYLPYLQANKSCQKIEQKQNEKAGCESMIAQRPQCSQIDNYSANTVAKMQDQKSVKQSRSGVYMLLLPLSIVIIKLVLMLSRF